MTVFRSLPRRGMTWTMLLTVVGLLCLGHGVTGHGTEVDLDDLPDVVDLSWRLKINETIYFPSYPESFNMENVWKGDNILRHGVWVEANKFSMVIHVGTHMDAPCHVCKLEKCWRMHEVPFENLRGPAAVFDIKDKAAQDPNYEISMKDIKDWEEKNGKIPSGAFILVSTGGQKYFDDPSKYWGDWQNHNYAFPGFSQAAINYIVDNTNVKGIGMDWGIVDSGLSMASNDSNYYAHAHRHLLGDNRIIMEYVKNIELLPATGYTLYLNPLKLYDTCGAPLRMIAIKNPPSGARGLHATAVGGGMLSVVVMMVVTMMLCQ